MKPNINMWWVMHPTVRRDESPGLLQNTGCWIHLGVPDAWALRWGSTICTADTFSGELVSTHTWGPSDLLRVAVALGTYCDAANVLFGVVQYWPQEATKHLICG